MSWLCLSLGTALQLPAPVSLDTLAYSRVGRVECAHESERPVSADINNINHHFSHPTVQLSSTGVDRTGIFL